MRDLLRDLMSLGRIRARRDLGRIEMANPVRFVCITKDIMQMGRYVHDGLALATTFRTGGIEAEFTQTFCRGIGTANMTGHFSRNHSMPRVKYKISIASAPEKQQTSRDMMAEE